MDKVFKPYLKELATGRAEELAWEAEKLPEFKIKMERLQNLRAEPPALVGEEKAGELITAARGVDVPIIASDWRTAYVLAECLRS